MLELERRQRQVAEQEEHVEKSKVKLADEFDRKMVEMREASRRLEEDFRHQLNLERSKQKDAEERFVRKVR